MSEPTLKRRIGPGLLTAYGVGVMVGAGIYVLVGAVAAQAGVHAPLAFLLAGLVAAPTALSYAEFSTRLPRAAGEALYVAEGLNIRALSLLVGLAIVVAGTISAAAVLRGGAGYLQLVIEVPPVWAIVGIGAALIAVAVVGVLESLALAAVFTLIEVAGLALVVWAGMQAPTSPDLTTALPDRSLMSGIAAGAALAFFAFIGFEDIVNMAEEVRDPARTLPRAILWSLAITALLYGGVTYVAVRSVPLEALSASERPLALVWQAGQGGEARFLSGIAVVAALNGVLAQVVMAARVLFGLGDRHAAMALFHRAHLRTGTPVLATLLVGACVIAAALMLPVAVLAGVTSSVLLAVFGLVNLALILLKRRDPAAPFRVPLAVPVLGLLLSAAAFAATLLP
ncbi:APC family permease [Pseudooceanicola nitratireducens]|uniref:APC family permease n=1 Tax=Pseudooceanicola nitratireducens TaxID=517719 RepID=UPI001C98B0A3|nr:APC family permease [Pseudooceanicola nitratireducens]MBY6156658.1 APC family permease [Pseudooceanicola nitratireducens]